MLILRFLKFFHLMTSLSSELSYTSSSYLLRDTEYIMPYIFLSPFHSLSYQRWKPSLHIFVVSINTIELFTYQVHNMYVLACDQKLLCPFLCPLLLDPKV